MATKTIRPLENHDALAEIPQTNRRIGAGRAAPDDAHVALDLEATLGTNRGHTKARGGHSNEGIAGSLEHVSSTRPCHPSPHRCSATCAGSGPKVAASH